VDRRDRPAVTCPLYRSRTWPSEPEQDDAPKNSVGSVARGDVAPRPR
jgi:hypothetical protein